jgi:putative ABC transport system permease protein
VQDELSYDRYHENAGQIYRVITISNEDPSQGNARVGAPWGPALQRDYPEVLRSVRFRFFGRSSISCGDKRFYEEGGLYADSTVFEAFTFPLLKGNPQTALARPNTVVISEAMARKYFGDENPIGKTLNVDNESDLQVTGVMKNVRRNSHFRFDFLVSFATYDFWDLNEWRMNNFHVYLLLAEDYPAAALENKFPEFVAKYVDEQADERFTAQLQPITSIHLHSHLFRELEANSDIAYVYIFSAIALFVLLIACVNFMNLATARSASRAREIGLRKVVGAQRAQLIRQFLGESILLSFIALFLTIGLVELLLPTFNHLSGKELSIDYGENPLLTFGLIGITLFVGVISGAYPAIFLSSFRPATVLKATPKAGASGSLLRKGLVVVQFAISVVLIVGTGIVYQQLGYISSKRLGFNKEQVLVVRMQNEALKQKYELIKNELSQHPNVASVAATSGLLGGGDWGMPFGFEGAQHEEKFSARVLVVDHDYVETMQMKMIAGRNFSRDFPTDASEAFLINETAARQLGWESPIGKYLERPASRNDDGSWNWQRGRIIGVVQDFHFRSLHEKIDPMIMYMQPASLSYFFVRMQASQIPAALAYLEEKWHAFEPNLPFDYFFLDEVFDQMYRAERHLGKIFGTFSFLAIFIACLGLFGLAAFAAEQRTKEIGVRKVLGATVGSIVLLVSREFARLVLIAFVFAAPVAYYLMSQWLQNFAYRTGIGWWVIAMAGVLAFGIALLTVSYQAIRAALTNPVEALRYE